MSYLIAAGCCWMVAVLAAIVLFHAPQRPQVTHEALEALLYVDTIFYFFHGPPLGIEME